MEHEHNISDEEISKLITKVHSSQRVFSNSVIISFVGIITITLLAFWMHSKFSFFVLFAATGGVFCFLKEAQKDFFENVKKMEDYFLALKKKL